MTTGTVKRFNAEKGTGYIISDDGKQLSFHFSDILKEGFKELSEDQRVEYEISEDSDGRSWAVNIKII